MKMVFVPHGAKLTGVGQYPPELGADPPMTMEGKQKMLKLVPALQALGPYDSAFCSLMDRACGTMCTIVKQLGIKRVVCIDELGQMGNLDSDGKVIAYPGHEKDDIITWQEQGYKAIGMISDEALKDGWPLVAAYGPGGVPERKVLVFSHRPILAGLVAHAKGITDAPGIQTILDDPTLVKNGFVVFNYNGTNLILTE